jgi:crotonobetainyl-CoA:carnitine CoA-transferase CaiB-like acyl-CoA transferase
MKRLQLGFDDLAAINPRLVYCSVSAYGQTGPWKDKPGVDGVIQAVSGLMSVTGSPDAPPCKVQVPVVDMVTGYLAAIAVLGALNQRHSDDRGQYIDMSMFGSAIALQQSTFAAYLADDIVPERIGSAAPYAAPNEALRCADGWIMVAAYHPARWLALCQTLGAPDLAVDDRFAELGSRIANRKVLVQELEKFMRRWSKAEWLRRFEAVDIICAPINDYAEVVASPTYVDAGISEQIMHAAAGAIRVPRSPFSARNATPTPPTAPPMLGEHTREVLAELGCTDELIGNVLARRSAPIPQQD